MRWCLFKKNIDILKHRRTMPSLLSYKREMFKKQKIYLFYILYIDRIFTINGDCNVCIYN